MQSVSDDPLAGFLARLDLARARQLYVDRLGLMPRFQAGPSLALAAGAPELCLTQVELFMPQPHTVLG